MYVLLEHISLCFPKTLRYQMLQIRRDLVHNSQGQVPKDSSSPHPIETLDPISICVVLLRFSPVHDIPPRGNTYAYVCTYVSVHICTRSCFLLTLCDASLCGTSCAAAGCEHLVV